MDRWTLHLGDMADVLAGLEPESVDACVCDPPYELGFMGKSWDSAGVSFRPETWAAVLRVLKPGAHLLAFGGTRTFHRIACAIEDAGFEVRDSLAFIHGQGFPKSLDVSKAIDKEEGIWRGRAGSVVSNNSCMSAPNYERTDKGEPVTAAAAAWSGWGSALKPAFEPIIMARKPLRESSIARQVLATGTGGINVDGCRVGTEEVNTHSRGIATAYAKRSGEKFGYESNRCDFRTVDTSSRIGRFPPNLLLQHSEDCTTTCVEGCPVREMGEQSGESRTPRSVTRGSGGQHGCYSPIGRQDGMDCFGDSGTAARFFPCFRYIAKPSRSERELGCDELEPATLNRVNPGGLENDPRWAPVQRRNVHATVKSIALMRWLCRLVTPPGGIVLDPFSGSGTTGMAALWEGFRFVGCEMDPTYHRIAEARIRYAAEHDPPEETGTKSAPLTAGQGKLW